MSRKYFQIPEIRKNQLVAEVRDRLMAGVPDLMRYNAAQRGAMAEDMAEFAFDLITDVQRLVVLGDAPVVRAVLKDRTFTKATLTMEEDEADKIRAQHAGALVALVLLHPDQFQERMPAHSQPELPFDLPPPSPGASAADDSTPPVDEPGGAGAAETPPAAGGEDVAKPQADAASPPPAADAAGRKARYVAEGRAAGMRGLPADRCPYDGGHKKTWWLEGHGAAGQAVAAQVPTSQAQPEAQSAAEQPEPKRFECKTYRGEEDGQTFFYLYDLARGKEVPKASAWHEHHILALADDLNAAEVASVMLISDAKIAEIVTAWRVSIGAAPDDDSSSVPEPSEDESTMEEDAIEQSLSDEAGEDDPAGEYVAWERGGSAGVYLVLDGEQVDITNACGTKAEADALVEKLKQVLPEPTESTYSKMWPVVDAWLAEKKARDADAARESALPADEPRFVLSHDVTTGAVTLRDNTGKNPPISTHNERAVNNAFRALVERGDLGPPSELDVARVFGFLQQAVADEKALDIPDHLRRSKQA